MPHNADNLPNADNPFGTHPSGGYNPHFISLQNEHYRIFQELSARLTTPVNDQPKFPFLLNSSIITNFANQAQAVAARIEDGAPAEMDTIDVCMREVGTKARRHAGKIARNVESLKTGPARSRGVRSSSNFTSPASRNAGSFRNAKEWLLGWLLHVNMLRCPMTLIQLSCVGLLQFAHILIPNAMESSHDLLTIYEWVLGMTFGSLCKQSRLFLLPAIIVGITLNLWRLMVPLICQANGQIYRYFLVPHPNTDPMILAHIHHPIPAFYSHVSPFAFLLNAFHTLAVWSSPSDGYRGYIDSSVNDRSRVLYQGLSMLNIEPTECYGLSELRFGISHTNMGNSVLEPFEGMTLKFSGDLSISSDWSNDSSLGQEEELDFSRVFPLQTGGLSAAQQIAHDWRQIHTQAPAPSLRSSVHTGSLATLVIPCKALDKAMDLIEGSVDG
ncbi:hypothetical protein F5050DRAFT_1834200 [Lentinula boryana]|uniref:Uncharacterized protein n=1 Tax=Lentinula boryana TaxID=40481 RepID=A0ABQ8QQ47_9AGAR|nr:hypothetical protein F5050DRAFT_1834200 [Lentinula boryana]